MKSVTLIAFLLASVLAVVFCDTLNYAPEYEVLPQEHHVRNKRHVSALPFLGGVAIGGIFGPILYNRLYGWKPVQVAWKEPVQQGWQPAPAQQGWQPQQNQGWE